MNYNDYIIRDNKDFVREFDTMYREIDDPWGQQTRGVTDTSYNILIAALKNIFTGKLILDIGCGPGHLSDSIFQQLGADKYIGCDISETAIAKARIANPQHSFEVMNIITDTKPIEADLITVLKTLYYCAPEIDITIRNLYKMIKKGGYLAYSYNIKDNSFTNRYLNIEMLREKMESEGFFCKKYISDYYFADERIAIDVFEKL